MNIFKINKILMYIIPLLIASIVNIAQADGLFTPNPNAPWYAGSDISYSYTPGYVSEFKNKIKVKTNRAKLRLNIKAAHVAYVRDEATAKSGNVDNINDSLINRTFNWVGVGIHTNKGTYFTYYKDIDSDYWKVDVINETKVRDRITLVNGFFHLDHTGGDLINSGGRRTTGASIGLKARLFKKAYVGVNYEIFNNNASDVEDKFFINIGSEF